MDQLLDYLPHHMAHCPPRSLRLWIWEIDMDMDMDMESVPRACWPTRRLLPLLNTDQDEIIFGLQCLCAREGPRTSVPSIHPSMYADH